jgi:flagellar motility protein MotE (MotC chaperone)
MTDGLSVISENTVFTGKITHAERNLTKLDAKKRDDLDKLKYTIEEQKEELAEVKQKYKAAMARRDTLETQ